MLAASGAGGGSGGGSGSGSSGGGSTLGGAASPPPDLPALVDDLRAEVASARAVLQQLKHKAATQAGGSASAGPR